MKQNLWNYDRLLRKSSSVLEAIAKIFIRSIRMAEAKGKIHWDGQTRSSSLRFSYGFFEFETEQMAIEAQKIADGLRLDRNYTFSAILVSNYDQSVSQIVRKVVDKEDLHLSL